MGPRRWFLFAYDQHFLWTMEGLDSSYSCLEIHICMDLESREHIQFWLRREDADLLRNCSWYWWLWFLIWELDKGYDESASLDTGEYCWSSADRWFFKSSGEIGIWGNDIWHKAGCPFVAEKWTKKFLKYTWILEFIYFHHLPPKETCLGNLENWDFSMHYQLVANSRVLVTNRDAFVDCWKLA